MAFNAGIGFDMINAGKNYKCFQKLMPKTGTRVLATTDANANLINKTVIPGANASNSHLTSISSNFVDGKPVQLALRKNDFVKLYSNDPKTNFLNKTDFLRPGDLGFEKTADKAKALKFDVQTNNGVDVVYLRDSAGSLINRIEAPQNMTAGSIVSSANYAQGKPVQTILRQDNYATVFENNPLTGQPKVRIINAKDLS